MARYRCCIDKSENWERSWGNKTSPQKYAERLMQCWPHPAWHGDAGVCFCAEARRLRRDSPIARQISWTLDERWLGGRKRGRERERGTGSGETSLRRCHNKHVNQPRGGCRVHTPRCTDAHVSRAWVNWRFLPNYMSQGTILSCGRPERGPPVLSRRRVRHQETTEWKEWSLVYLGKLWRERRKKKKRSTGSLYWYHI